MSEPGKSPRRFSNAFKEAAVRRLEGGEKIAAVASTIGVRRKLLYDSSSTVGALMRVISR